MPIRIEVVSCGGAPPSVPMAADFDELGGDIGRGDDSILILPDPERFISRTHASVSFKAGHYVLLDKGKTVPVQLNGRALGHGVEAAIAEGDEIAIGAYRMKVTTVAPEVPTTERTPEIQGAKDDPLALFGGAPPAPPAQAASGAARTPSLLDDPFAPPPSARDEVRPAEHPPSPHLPEDVDFGLGLTPTNRNIDDAFDLPPAGTGELFPPGSPLAGTAAGESVDPLAAFGGASPSPPGPPQRNDTPELKGSFRVPRAEPEPAPADQGGQQFDAPPAPPATAAPSPSPSIRGGGAANDDLLAAFLDGAGVPNLQVPGGLTAETMNQLGRVFREALQGTLDLLLARATLKREVRADMTLIVGRENNPLKFSPNVEAALAQLLAPRAPGLMTPLEAMKDAYDDLRSHQFAFMAGMRAALAAVLQRFDPATLEQRLTQKSVMDTVLPMNRRAKLWGLFQSLYGEISREAEDDFHALFGKEFVRAYQAQVEQMNRTVEDDER